MRLLALALFSSLVTGCVIEEDPKDEQVDADGDLYFSVESGGDDCDDGDASVNPGAAEVCDGIDNDCDALTDDADDSVDPATQTAAYPDADGDGFGGDDGMVLACEPPADHLLSGGDCDDTRSNVNPAGAEVCDADGLDEDCDGLVNDDDASVAGQATWYPDADGDGYGAMDGIAACFQPEGHVLETGDCDDARADVSPDGTEVCDALDADEDCDGAVDDADDDVSGQVAWYVDADGDGWGGEASTVRCDGVAGETANAGDCDDSDPDRNGDDRDGDGESSCDGDCDDGDTGVTSRDCRYASMEGVFTIPSVCDFEVSGTGLDAPVQCTDCEFAFESVGTLTSGSCVSTFAAELGWDEDTEELAFWLQSSYTGSYYDIGSFAGAITAGSGYDILEWGGYGMVGYYYGGTFFLYR